VQTLGRPELGLMLVVLALVLALVLGQVLVLAQNPGREQLGLSVQETVFGRMHVTVHAIDQFYLLRWPQRMQGTARQQKREAVCARDALLA
jgi:hypothetical protein